MAGGVRVQLAVIPHACSWLRDNFVFCKAHCCSCRKWLRYWQLAMKVVVIHFITVLAVSNETGRNTFHYDIGS